MYIHPKRIISTLAKPHFRGKWGDIGEDPHDAIFVSNTPTQLTKQRRRGRYIEHV